MLIMQIAIRMRSDNNKYVYVLCKKYLIAIFVYYYIM